MLKDYHFSSRSLCSFERPGRGRRKSVFLGAWLIGSAVGAAWLASVLLTGSSLAGADTAPSYLVSSQANVSNPARKGDRLDRVFLRSEISGKTGLPARSSSLRADGQIGAASFRGQSLPASKSERKIPVGCETAFSRLVGSQKLSVRCVTGVHRDVKLAESLANQQT
jgi:hypothetical protein